MPTSSMMMKRMFGGLVRASAMAGSIGRNAMASMAVAIAPPSTDPVVVLMCAPPFRRAARRTPSAPIAGEAPANHKDTVRLRFDSFPIRLRQATMVRLPARLELLLSARGECRDGYGDCARLPLRIPRRRQVTLGLWTTGARASDRSAAARRFDGGGERIAV